MAIYREDSANSRALGGNAVRSPGVARSGLPSSSPGGIASVHPTVGALRQYWQPPDTRVKTIETVSAHLLRGEQTFADHGGGV